jgi:nucleoside-diphosphate-sugar epimerase
VTEAAARLAGQTTILTADKANEFFQPAWTGDPEPLARDTGWRAIRNLETGLAETYAWYRTAGWL